MPLKIMTIVGTRPELIKLSRVIAELDQHVEHILVHTGQNYDYELNEVFFRELDIRQPDYFLDVAAKTVAATVGNVISKVDVVLEDEAPDALLVLGDTNSSLVAYPAKRRKIPIFHMEAGNRCFDPRVPEEINRKIVDHLSDINLTYTEHARRYLLAEGLRPETVIKTGSPMKEVLTHYSGLIDASTVLDAFALCSNKYLLVSVHREENVDSEKNFRQILESLQMAEAELDMPVIVSTHPRTRKRLSEVPDMELSDRIRFVPPLGFPDYVKLQKNAYCVISDSGTITEESSILSFPAVMIRQAHERPEGMDEGVLVMCGFDSVAVLEAINVVTEQVRCHGHARLVADYDVDNVAMKVVRIILSYRDYVKRTVWFE